jgi:chromosome segregation ATPase
VTFDGALVAAEGSAIGELLGSSHVHSGNTTISLRDKLQRLHEGLYYADVTIDREGAYVIHSAAFHRGLLSHDSKVVSATRSSISTIQESITELDSRLNATNNELQHLQEGIQDTRVSLNDTQSAITTSVEDARGSIRGDIEAMQQATGQINSLILPVLALISIIIALQISLFARIRASFR